MRVSIYVIGAVLGFGLGFGCLAPGQAQVTGQQLTHAELKALYTGLVTRTITHRDNVLTNRYNADGTVSGRTSNGSTDTGVWSIDGDRVCTQWKKWEQGQRYCGVVLRFGDQYQLTINGTARSRFVVAKD